MEWRTKTHAKILKSWTKDTEQDGVENQHSSLCSNGMPCLFVFLFVCLFFFFFFFCEKFEDLLKNCQSSPRAGDLACSSKAVRLFFARL